MTTARSGLWLAVCAIVLTLGAGTLAVRELCPVYAYAAPDPAPICRGTTKAGLKCKNRTRHPSGFCHLHRAQAPKK